MTEPQDLDAFIARFHALKDQDGTYRQAYQKAEAEHLRATGERRYKNYVTFRNVLSRRLRVRRIKVVNSTK